MAFMHVSKPPILGNNRIVLLLIAIAFSILIALGIVADNLISQWELGNLLTATEASEASMHDFQSSVDSLTVPKDANGSTDVAAAAESVTGECGRGATNVQTARAALEDVAILPWHQAIARAKNRYLDHNAAWLKHLRACATDWVKFIDKAQGSEISATFNIAAMSYRACLPPFAPSEERARIDAIFGSG